MVLFSIKKVSDSERLCNLYKLKMKVVVHFTRQCTDFFKCCGQNQNCSLCQFPQDSLHWGIKRRPASADRTARAANFRRDL